MLGPAILWLIAVIGFFAIGIRFARLYRPVANGVVLTAFVSALIVLFVGMCIGEVASAISAVPAAGLLAFAIEARPRRRHTFTH